jgi:cell division protein FtsB
MEEIEKKDQEISTLMIKNETLNSEIERLKNKPPMVRTIIFVLTVISKPICL